jgi:hypothetical protein
MECLVAAPSPEAVRNTTKSLGNKLLPRFRRYLETESLGETDVDFESNSPPATGDTPFAYSKWRLVTRKRSWEEFSTEDSIPWAFEGRDDWLGSIQPVVDDRATDFLRHSFLAYSQAEVEDRLDETTILSSDFSFTTQSFDVSSTDALAALPTEFTIPTLTSIKSLPASDYILATAPRLFKVNMLVGVISLLPTHTVTLQRTKQEMNIYKLLVGDDTSAGFTINFWASAKGDDREFLKVLPAVRTRDIVLLRNVALGIYRGKVYGQTLNPRWSRAETTVEVIGKDGLVVGKALGGVQGKNQLERVISWVSTYLWRPAEGRARKDPDALPPDSMPSRN